MKAAVHTSYGPPEVVRITEVDKPTPQGQRGAGQGARHDGEPDRLRLAGGQALINRFFTGLLRPRVTVLGSEFAGVVEGVGRRVTSFEVSDRVFGFSGSRFGAHAEYLAIPEDGFVATMPANLTYEQAAPSTEGSHYALSAIRAAKVRSGHDVPVNGVTGAIGSAAVQLLKQLGAAVTAVCGTEHVELVKDLGADRVIDYTAEAFTKTPSATT
jgi:NADPH:quinone reductase-like Zn-dependent oxidoreductase